MSITEFKEVTEYASKRFENSPLGKMSEGKVFEKPMSDYDKPLGLLDDNNNEYSADGKLLPNTTYILNGNKYRTDEKGRIISCEYTPHLTPENSRDNAAQVAAGGENRKSGDQGGHIVGRDIGGDAGLGNLVAMDSRINQSDYKLMEKAMKDALEEGKIVNVKTVLEYSGDSKRPDKIITTVTVEGKETVYTFDSNLDGCLIDKLKETCTESDIETVQSVLDDKKGQISSTKEEFDEKGNLVKTTVRITYVRENGKNDRVEVVINHTNDGGVSK